jgi:hypothetical protein
MGMAKKHMMKWQELGLCGGHGGTVCGRCINDPVLAEFIAENAYEESCSYCGREEEDNPFACDMADVVEFMAEAINEVWTDPANELPYEGREGGYQGEMLGGWEVLEESGFEPENSKVFEDAASYFIGQDWCRSDYYGTTPAERHRWGWERFCREVKHSRRYTFWSSVESNDSDDYQDNIPPGVMLAEMNDVIHRQELIREIPAETEYWRVRQHERGKVFSVPNDFTSPPVWFAVQPNRMSPAGISMFYGADDFDTGVLEVAGKEAHEGQEASGLVFKACRPLQILDLIHLGRGWSFFAPDGRDRWHRSEFLRYFTADVSRPIKRDQRQHIDYVPTQAFTEYVRFHVQSPAGKPVDGIRYFSSQNRRACCVLFFDSDDCLQDQDGRPQALKAVPTSLKTVSLETPR